MPRRAAADVAVLVPGQPVQRLRPPKDMSEPERETFADIVTAVPAAHFQPQDLPLLCAYVRAIEMERAAHRQLRENGPITADGKTSPWLGVHAHALKSMAALSMRLRLSPQGRSPTNSKRAAPVSYYERAALGEVNED
jgi:phage terminase small subunit